MRLPLGRRCHCRANAGSVDRRLSELPLQLAFSWTLSATKIALSTKPPFYNASLQVRALSYSTMHID